MTVPTLVQNYQRKSFVTQLRKVTSELSQAAERYKSDNNYISLKESRIIGNREELNRFVKTYFKVVKDCAGSYVPCFANSYEKIESNDTVTLASHACWATVVLASGAAVCFDTGNYEANKADKDVNNDGKIDDDDIIYNNGLNEGAAMSIEIDVNGLQGPNIIGRDLFFVDITADGTVIDAEGGNGYFGQIVNAGWEMNY